jgi:hypothetical protein
MEEDNWYSNGLMTGERDGDRPRAPSRSDISTPALLYTMLFSRCSSPVEVLISLVIVQECFKHLLRSIVCGSVEAAI